MKYTQKFSVTGAGWHQGACVDEVGDTSRLPTWKDSALFLHQTLAGCSLADQEVVQAKEFSRNHLDDLKSLGIEFQFP